MWMIRAYHLPRVLFEKKKRRDGINASLHLTTYIRARVIIVINISR